MATAAQLAARKTFADMARSGAFKKRAKKKPVKAAAKKTVKRNPVRATQVKQARAPRKAVAVKRNPATATRAVASFKVYRADHDGKPSGRELGSFPVKQNAIDYAKAYMKAHNCAVVIVGKGL